MAHRVLPSAPLFAFTCRSLRLVLAPLSLRRRTGLYAVAAALIACFLAPFAASQQTLASASPAATVAQPDNSDHAQIQAVLGKYEAAYDHHSVEGLIAIWPDLPNQPKELKKLRWHLADDPDVFSEKMTVEPLDWQIDKDQASVKCKRKEVYVMIESRTEIATSDLRNETGQLVDPAPSTSKKVKNKTDTVWFQMHRLNGAWVIASISEKPPR